MPESRDEHRIFIVNETDEPPFVTPKTLAVERGDRVHFVVVGEKEKFTICPGSDVFRSIEAGEEITAGLGSPPMATVRQGVDLNSVHRYEVHTAAKGSIDPILLVHE